MNLHLKSAQRLLAVVAIVTTLVPAGSTAAAALPTYAKANQRCTSESAERTIKGQVQRCVRNVKGILRWTATKKTETPGNAQVLQIPNAMGFGYLDGSIFLKVLNNGSTLLGGRFSGSTTIGETTVRENQTYWASPPDRRDQIEDRFLARVSPSFTWSNAERFGGSGPTLYSAIGPIVALSDGSAIVTGRWQGQISLGSKTMTSRSPNGDTYGRTSNAFFGRLMPDGSWAWADGLGAAGGSEIRGAIETTDGSILLTGWLRTADVESGTFNHEATSNQHFILLISRDGVRLSSRMLPITVSVQDSASNEGAWLDFSLASSLADGSTLIVGEYCGSISFGSRTLPSQSTTRGKKNDCGGFVGRVRPDFSFDWLSELPLRQSTADSVRPNGGITHYTVATNGDLIIQGWLFRGEWQFGKTTLKNSGKASFVARIDTQGSWKWAQSIAVGAQGFYILNGIASTPDNGAVVLGNIYQPSVALGKLRFSKGVGIDGFVAKLNASGNWTWVTGTKTKTVKESDMNTSLADVAVAQDGTILVAGRMTGTVTFGSTSVASRDWELATFVARLTPSGVWR